MNRSEFLRSERERLIALLRDKNQNKAKVLAELMDIDDEIEEIKNKEKSFLSFKENRVLTA